MSLFIVLATNTAPDKLQGLEVKYWFGFVLLAVAVVLAVAQAWVSIHPAPQAIDPETAKKTVDEVASKARDAAEQAQDAAAKAREAVEHVRQAESFVADDGRLLVTGMTDEVTSFVRDAVARRAAVDQAATVATNAAEDAKKAADAATDAASNTSFLGLASTVAIKLPLVGGAILFALLGSAVAGFISISFG